MASLKSIGVRQIRPSRGCNVDRAHRINNPEVPVEKWLTSATVGAVVMARAGHVVTPMAGGGGLAGGPTTQALEGGAGG